MSDAAFMLILFGMMTIAILIIFIIDILWRIWSQVYQDFRNPIPDEPPPCPPLRRSSL